MIDSDKIKELFPNYQEKCNREYYIINKEHFYFSQKDALKYLSELLQEYSTDFINVECCDAQAGNDPVIAYYFYDESLDGESVLEGTFYAFESQEHLDLFVREQSYSSHNVVIQLQ